MSRTKGIKPKNWNSLYTPKINKKRSNALKGIKKSAETKKRISEAKKGKPSLKIRGKNHYKWKEKIEKVCEVCSKKYDIYLSHEKSKFCSYKCYWDSLKGEGSPTWKGGISFEPYSIDWTETLKRSIRERDRYICQLCNKEPAICVHHIDYNKKNCNPNNLITLCRGCNTKVNYNRDYWTNYFKEKVGFIIKEIRK